MKLISYAMKLTENPLRWAGHKLLLSVVVIDQIVYLPSLAQIDSCPRSRKYAHRRTRVIWPATYN